MAFDAVITIGGQSFVDGLWRLLAPALERLTNPLPLTLPGFTNSQVRITNIVPVYPGNLPGNGLELALTLEATAEAILQVTTQTGAVDIALGPQSFDIDTLTGPLSGVTGSGTINLPNSLGVPGIPLPAIVPVALDLTQHLPLITRALVPIAVSGPTAATRRSLLFLVTTPQVDPIPAFSPAAITELSGDIDDVIAQIIKQLGIDTTVVSQPAPTDVQALLAPVPGLIVEAIADALTLLLAETGRIVFPLPGAGASCDAKALANSAEARLEPTPNNGFELQVGFSRGVGTDDIAVFPAPINNPNSTIETRIIIGNRFLVALLCCLVEQLPAFGFPEPASFDTSDINGNPHVACCNFRFVTAEFGPIPVAGRLSEGISICLDGAPGGAKIITIVGHFSQIVRNVVPVVSSIFGTLATINADFTLTLGFDLNDVTALTNLRNVRVPVVATSVNPAGGLFALIALVLLLILAIPLAIALGVGWLAAPVVIPIVLFLLAAAGGVVTLLVFLACGVVNFVLANAIRLLLKGAALLKSPVAIPPGLLDAFGKVSPVSLTVDDAIAPGVMHTPTSVWGLLPRIGLPVRRPPKGRGTDGKGTGKDGKDRPVSEDVIPVR